MRTQEEKRARDPKYYFDKSQAQDQTPSSSTPPASANGEQHASQPQGFAGGDAGGDDGPRGKKRARAEDFL